MKKQYIKPSTEATQMGAAQIFATSFTVGGDTTETALTPEYKPWGNAWGE